jgi:integrase
MARPATGTVVRKPTKQGTSFALKVRYRGERHFVHLGGEWEGWTEERVQHEREYIAAQIARGEWMPLAPSQAAAATTPATASGQTLQVFASAVLARKRQRLSPKGYADLKWRLEVCVHFLGELPVGVIDEGLIEDRLVGPLLAERAAIEQARLDGQPLMETVTDKRGRTYRRRRRGLSRGSVNKILGGLNVVMKEARRRKLIDRNPAEDRELRVRAEATQRSFLEVCQVEAVLRAAQLIEVEHVGLTWEKVRYIRASELSAVALARELHISDVTIGKVRRGLLWTDERGPRNRNDLPRHAILAMLVMAGVRVSELCGLEWERHIDFASARVSITRDITKTDAGVRVIPMVPVLRDVLLAHRADRGAGATHVFGTRNGTQNTPDNVRSTIIDAARDRANEVLAEAGLPQIAHMTPHTLRRTFASILAELDVSYRRAMYLLGHTNPKLTMTVYQHVLDLGDGQLELLERLLGGGTDDLFLILSGRSAGCDWSPIGHPRRKKALTTVPEDWS